MTNSHLTIHTKYQTELEMLEKKIFSHPAWHGHLLGMECEETLRGNLPHSYLLRTGEARFHYYLSAVMEDFFTFKHQPFFIAWENDELGWGYRNGHTRWQSQFEDLIPFILRCPAEKCLPILKTR